MRQMVGVCGSLKEYYMILTSYTTMIQTRFSSPITRMPPKLATMLSCNHLSFS